MEVFNPNPTIFAPAKSHRVAQFAKPHSLWLNDEDSDAEKDIEDESTEAESIDQDEIFGEFLLRPQAALGTSIRIDITLQISSGQYPTQSTGV